MSNKKKLEQAYRTIHTLLCDLEESISSQRHMQVVDGRILLNELWARATRRRLVAATKMISEAMGYERPKQWPKAAILDLYRLKKKVPNDEPTQS